jgi:D-alanyl-D-alanine carboxypeptidase/D-alanyl-D-alanine-endopeptidase (penicillin-binding protein 4)
VSDVTKLMSVRIVAVLAALAMLAGVVALGVTVLRPEPVTPVPRVPLAERVPGAVLPAAAAAVLPGIGTEAPVPSADALDRVLLPLIATKALGPGVSIDVLDPLTGDHLMSEGPTTARTPASTAKLLTAAAALTALGPQTTLATRVVTGASAAEVVLIGGGDVMLSGGTGDPTAVNGRAGLRELARQTVTALRARNRSSVRLTLDDRLFTGPTRSPRWSENDVVDGYVAPIQALAVNVGRIGTGKYARRSSDPAMDAARTFAGLLEKRGINVAGSVRRGAAPKPARNRGVELGRVQSASVAGLVEYSLTESDNTVAEALGRLVAIDAGEPGSFAAAGPAVLRELGNLGVPVNAAVLSDTSGLGDGSRVPPQVLTGLLALAAGTEQPQLRAVLSGLPIAAVSGTLVDRFSGSGQRAALGVVRAKTGTLTGVSSLAGTVVDSDGRLLVFAAMADRVKSTNAARTALDRIAATLAACGCR